MTSRNQDNQRDLRFNLSDMEAMRTHDLAELLSNFVLLLRRLPDMKFSELAQLPTEQQDQASNTSGDDLVTRANERVNGQSQPVWWAEKDQQR
jgi:hypothetical protein